MSGERLILSASERNLSLADKHALLADGPGPKSGRVGVVEKVEAYLMDANHFNKKELARRTYFLTKDQRNHIIEEVKAEWATRRPYNVGNYRVEPHIREGNKNLSVQYSFRNLQTGRFERARKLEDENATQ
jgi:hypothetical protein